jgi:hypothetical protein
MNVFLFVIKNQLGFLKVTPFSQKTNFSGLRMLPSKSTLDLKIFFEVFKVKGYLFTPQTGVTKVIIILLL